MRKKTKRGITLIELIMAMAILTAISIPTATMIGAQIQGMARSSDIVAAGNAGRFAMEQLSNFPYTASLFDPPPATHSLVVGYYTVTWVVTLSGSGAGETKGITMTVVRTGTSPVLATFYNTFCNGVTNGV